MKCKYGLYTVGENTNLEMYLDQPSQKLRDAIERGEGILYDAHPPVDSGNLVFYTVKNREVVLDKAKLHSFAMNNLRAQRNQALEVLDKEQLKSIANQERIKKIESVKQELRDVTQAIDLSQVNTVQDALHISPPVLMTYMEDIQ